MSKNPGCPVLAFFWLGRGSSTIQTKNPVPAKPRLERGTRQVTQLLLPDPRNPNERFLAALRPFLAFFFGLTFERIFTPPAQEYGAKNNRAQQCASKATRFDQFFLAKSE